MAQLSDQEKKESLLQLEKVGSKSGAQKYIADALSTLQTEVHQYLESISCWLCNKNADEVELFWMCQDCEVPGNPFAYYCDGCKDRTDKRHQNMGHPLNGKQMDKAMLYSVIGYQKLREGFRALAKPLSDGIEITHNAKVVGCAGLNLVATPAAAAATLLLKLGPHITPIAFVSGQLAVVPIFLFTVDTIYNTVQLCIGNISGKEWALEMGRSVTTNGAMFGGSLVGGLAGAVGGFVAGGPIGLVIGWFVGAAIGGAGGQWAGNKLYSKIFGKSTYDKDDYQKAEDAEVLKRRAFLIEALKYFHYDLSDVVLDSVSFTERIINKRYRAYAKECHPDRFANDSSAQRKKAHQKFCELNNHFGVLLAAYALVHKNEPLDKAQIKKIAGSIQL